jgi:hypothetical protein
MALTLLDLSERVWTHTRDDDHEFITSEDVRAWLNDAQTELATRLDLIRREVSASTDGTNLIALPDDNLTVLSLRLGTDDVEFVDDDIWNAWSDLGSSPSSTIARIFAGNLELYPTPDTDTDYTLRYAALPTELVEDTDESELPPQWHVHLTFYAISQAYAKEKDVFMADRWLARWEESLPQMPFGREALDPGPTNLVPMAGPFDVLDGDDGPIHR